MYYFMDMFYALGMNITKKVCVKFGQMDDVEKKYRKFDEVIALMEQAVKEPESSGNYYDYIELCKLYDKNENGTMMLAELETFLSLLGEMFTSVFTMIQSPLQRPLFALWVWEGVGARLHGSALE